LPVSYDVIMPVPALNIINRAVATLATSSWLVPTGAAHGIQAVPPPEENHQEEVQNNGVALELLVEAIKKSCYEGVIEIGMDIGHCCR